MSATLQGGKPITRVHLNHAGASPLPQCVTDRVLQHLQLEQDLGGYAAQDAVAKELEHVYEDVARLIHARSSNEIALVESATVGWTRIFYAMAQQEETRLRKDRKHLHKANQKTRRIILVSEAEYAANVVAVCQWARDHEENDWMVLAIPSSKTSTQVSSGMVDLQVLAQMLSGKYAYRDTTGQPEVLDPTNIAMVCITHVPTNSGIINPVESIGDLIGSFNQQRQQKEGPELSSILYLVDACQSVGQLVVDVQKIQCHGLVATGRKYLRAPRGTGFLYVAQELLNRNIMPSHIDHFGCPVTSVPLTTTYTDGVQLQQESVLPFAPLSSARRFEFWESNVANRLGMGEAVRYAMETGTSHIEHSILQLSVTLRRNLSMMTGIKVHHEESTKCGLVTFYCEFVSSKDLQAAMWEKGFELSVVPATSTPMDSSKTQVPDLLRASLTYFNTNKDLEAFCFTLSTFVDEKNTKA